MLLLDVSRGETTCSPSGYLLTCGPSANDHLSGECLPFLSSINWLTLLCKHTVHVASLVKTLDHKTLISHRQVAPKSKATAPRYGRLLALVRPYKVIPFNKTNLPVTCKTDLSNLEFLFESQAYENNYSTSQLLVSGKCE